MAEANRRVTDRFTFENITYDLGTQRQANGIAVISNGHFQNGYIANGAVQNGHGPVKSPPDGVRGAHGPLVSNGPVQETGEKIHIKDHHQFRPVPMPPNGRPPSIRLSFRKGNNSEEKNDNYAVIKKPNDDNDSNYEELPDQLPNSDSGYDSPVTPKEVDVENDNLTNTKKTSVPLLPKITSRANLKQQDKRLSVNLNTGLDGEPSNLTSSTS